MSQTSAKPPISSHALFPAIVAIWFAALFGLGCLVLPIVLLERISDASGIAALIPAAAPPLGMMARIVLSSGAGVFGALLGFAIARKVAQAQADGHTADFGRRLRFAEDALAEPVRRPLSASEELDIAPIESQTEELPVTPGPAPIPGRKRPLTIAEEPAPSHFPPIAPPPAQPAHWADEHPLMPSTAVVAEKAMALHGLGEPPASEVFERAEEAQSPEQGMGAPRNRPIETPAPPEPDPAEIELPETSASSAELETSLPFTEQADAASTAEAPPIAAPAQEPSPNNRAKRPASALAEPLRALLAGKVVPVDKVAGPLELLGMVQLAERLGRSMHEHSAGNLPAQTIAVPHPESQIVAPAQANGVAPDFVHPAPVADDDHGDDEDDAWDDREFADASYSSLLTINGQPPAAGASIRPDAGGRPIPTAPPRAFDAPADAAERISPHNARPDPVETERALRSALATLQRMSGAA